MSLSRGIKEYNLKIIISDFLTGNVIITLPCNTISPDSLSQICKDLIENDYIDKHGFIVKYGIEP